MRLCLSQIEGLALLKYQAMPSLRDIFHQLSCLGKLCSTEKAGGKASPSCTKSHLPGHSPPASNLAIGLIGLSIWLERFRGSQKQDERGPLNSYSSMSPAEHYQLYIGYSSVLLILLLVYVVSSIYCNCFHVHKKRFFEIKRFLFSSVGSLPNQKQGRPTQRGRPAN